MDVIRTFSFGHDANFLAARDMIEELAQPHSFLMQAHTGSITWKFGPDFPDRPRESLLKLAYQGARKRFVFGLRQDVAEAIAALRRVCWTKEFAVTPQNEVTFVGFEIKPGKPESWRKRVESILTTVAASRPTGPSEAAMDEGLKQLEKSFWAGVNRVAFPSAAAALSRQAEAFQTALKAKLDAAVLYVQRGESLPADNPAAGKYLADLDKWIRSQVDELQSAYKSWRQATGWSE